MKHIKEYMRSNNKLKLITFKEAVSTCIKEALLEDPKVFVMGTGIPGLDLKSDHNSERVRNTPISESALIGMAIGASRLGMRPIIDLMMSSFLYVAMDQLINQAGKSHYMYGRKIKTHFVCKVMTGFNSIGAAQHSSTPQALFIGNSGLKVIFPSNPYDAKGLLRAAIYDNNPVIFFEHFLLRSVKGKVPIKKYKIPLGKGKIIREGTDLSIITYGHSVIESLSVVEDLFKKRGLNAEIIDLRTLLPLDTKLIFDSVKKTGRVLIIEEAQERCSFSSYISCIINESCFKYLKSPVKRLNLPNIPTPFSKVLSEEISITRDKIIKAIESFL